MDLFLLIAESVLFLTFAALLFRKERMYGVYFLFLYIYVIFAQIGYLYVPEISMSIFAYFGEAIWRPVTLFVIASGISIFLYLYFVSARLRSFFHRHLVSHFRVEKSRNPSLERLAIRGIAVILALQLLLFVIAYNSISWENAQQDDVFRTTPALGILILFVKLSVGINLALYCMVREPLGKRRNRKLVGLLIASVALLFVLTFKLGNRTDEVAFMMGILVFEASRIKIRPRHFAIVGTLAFCLMLYLNFLQAHRTETGPRQMDFVTSLLYKDYFPPAHILFAAAAFHVITPGEVVTSNSGNALMFLGQPYLQANVMALFFPGGATRSASIGFYALAEGYLVMGYAGFLYNGIVLGTLLIFWRSLATTNSRRFNNFLIALMGALLVDLVRGQSSYYIKSLYIFVLPNAIIFLCLSQQRLRLRRAPAGIAAPRTSQALSSARDGSNP